MNVFHLRRSDNVLLLGEGNFSFCYSLVKFMQNVENSNFRNVFATCLESEKDSLISQEIKSFLEETGTNLIYAVDATKLSHHPMFKNLAFNKIIFNFPHVGGKMKIHLNRQLLQDFFAESSLILSNDGEVIVTLCGGQGGTPVEKIQRRWDDTWQVVEMAARSDLVLREARCFPVELFDNYISVGYRGKSKSFSIKNATVHSFRKGKPLLFNVDDEHKFINWHLFEGVLMTYVHKQKVTENPFKYPDSPQSYLIKILEDECRECDGDYYIASEAPLYSKFATQINQAECIVSGEKCYLRKTLLQVALNKDDGKNCLLIGLCFNQLSEDFSVPPAECHAAVFGPLREKICGSFIKKIQNIFHTYLQVSEGSNLSRLVKNDWFLVRDDLQNGININLDKILENIFDSNWRQLWAPGVEIKYGNLPLIIFPSIYFQKFVFDISFWCRNESLDIKSLLTFIQKIDYCDFIQSAYLINVYKPCGNRSKIHCFRIVYNSYYASLCRKKALFYHSLVGKVIEKIMNVEIV